MILNRRQILLSAVGMTAIPRLFAQQDDENNTKIAHRLNADSLTDDDLLFLQQVGLKWARVEFGERPIGYEALLATQQRFARFGMRIYSGVHYSYRSLKVQLGQPGRDKDIETYCQFLRDLGRLKIPIASYDFHPGNTYTTNVGAHGAATWRASSIWIISAAKWRSRSSTASTPPTISGRTTRTS